MDTREMFIMIEGVFYLLTAWEAEEDRVTCSDLELLETCYLAQDDPEDYREWLADDPIVPSFPSKDAALSWAKTHRF